MAVRKLRPPIAEDSARSGSGSCAGAPRPTSPGVSPPARRAFVGLGSNLGDRLAHLERAVELLAAGGDVVAVSPVYETEPVGGPEQGPYLNVVVELSTSDSAAVAPRALPRRRGGRATGCGPSVSGPAPSTPTCSSSATKGWTEPDLVVPHPRMYERRFVLAPLAELAPELVIQADLDSAVGSVRRVATLTRFTTSVTKLDR